jgi:hypothetical protein
MNVKIETIPHDQQRYPTVGDWLFDNNGDLVIHVSELSDWRLEMLVAVHELVEVLICKHRGISQEAVDAFDMKFEDKENEAGDDPSAPYVREHCLATSVERLLAAELGVSWKKYEEELDAL